MLTSPSITKQVHRNVYSSLPNIVVTHTHHSVDIPTSISLYGSVSYFLHKSVNHSDFDFAVNHQTIIRSLTS